MALVRLAIAITIYSVAMGVTVFLLTEHGGTIPDWFEVAMIFVTYSLFLLMPVRWIVMLLQIVRSIRTRPFPLFPGARNLQVAAAIVLHTVLGCVSLIGMLMLWVETRTGERVLGLILNALLPSATIAWMMHRRST